MKFKEERALPFEPTIKNLPDLSDLNTSKKCGTFDGYEILRNRFNQHIDAYCIVKDGIICGVLYVNTEEHHISNKTYLQIEKLWIHAQYRKRGLGASLISFVARKLKTPLMSNQIITPDGEIFYKALIASAVLDLYCYDLKTLKKKLKFPDDVFTNARYCILIERDFTATQDKVMFEDCRLPQHRFFVHVNNLANID